MGNNSERFLTCYNEIDKHLRRATESDRNIPFKSLVNYAAESDAAVRNLKLDLLEFSDLRNAIVHERTDQHVIAEPHIEVVKRFDKIMAAIIKPPIIRDYMSQSVKSFKTKEAIGAAVYQMYEKKFSQAPVYDDGQFVDLLTTNAIARWLGKNVSEEIFSLKETTIKDVLKYTEDNRHVSFMSPDESVFEVFEHINKKETQGIIIEAILITHSGKRTEKLLGIITVWDLPKLHQAIDI